MAKYKYDLEDRAFNFAKDIRSLVKTLPGNPANYEDSKQLLRSSSSIGANYLEANEALGKKDFLFRLKISRKEAKEAGFFLKLIIAGNADHLKNSNAFELLEESIQLKKILSAIIQKCANRDQILTP